MTYSDAQQAVFAKGTIPDGYFGERVSVQFAFDAPTGRTICVTKTGCFYHQNPQALTKEEALWLLRHHPINRGVRILK